MLLLPSNGKNVTSQVIFLIISKISALPPFDDKLAKSFNQKYLKKTIENGPVVRNTTNMSKAGTLSASKVFYFPNKQSQKFQPTTSGYKALQNTQGASGNSQRGTPIKIENGKSEYRGTYFFSDIKKIAPYWNHTH